MDEELRQQLVAIDEQLGRVPLPLGLQQRVLEAPAPARKVPGWIVLVAVTAAIALAFVLGRKTGHAGPDAEPLGVQPHVEPVASAPIAPPPSDGCPLTIAVKDETLVPRGCDVSLPSPAMAIAAHTPTRLVRVSRGIRVIEGDAFFAVEKVEPGEPTVQVEVEGGVIEVLGTRFVVHQARAEGHVDLLEGAIEFTAADGEHQSVIPGQRLRWADGRIAEDAAIAPPVDAPEAPPTEPRRPADPTAALDAALTEVAMLRRRGEYREAATLLRNTRAALRDPSASEILSYEEGTLRELYQPQAAACAFWRGHEKRFGDGGRYASAVAGRLSRLGCNDR